MDPRKKSALTAALSSPSDDQAAGRTEGSTQKDDLSSFPCLSDNTSADNASELSKALGQMGLERKGSLAGSAPTMGLAGGFTDFELNPYNIRSGREVVPASLTDSKMASNFLTEAVIGSLPKGLSISEREQIFSETPLSPTMNVLSSMPSNVVSSRSLEGRRLRRHGIQARGLFLRRQRNLVSDQ
eukprot:jgi/Picsp_1/4830/NSC_02197-R1_hypothetical protein CHLNCDRAFT_137776 [Chlorella variabilis]